MSEAAQDGPAGPELPRLDGAGIRLGGRTILDHVSFTWGWTAVRRRVPAPAVRPALGTVR